MKSENCLGVDAVLDVVRCVKAQSPLTAAMIWRWNEKASSWGCGADRGRVTCCGLERDCKPPHAWGPRDEVPVSGAE